MMPGLQPADRLFPGAVLESSHQQALLVSCVEATGHPCGPPHPCSVLLSVMSTPTLFKKIPIVLEEIQTISQMPLTHKSGSWFWALPVWAWAWVCERTFKFKSGNESVGPLPVHHADLPECRSALRVRVCARVSCRGSWPPSR